MAVGVVVEQAVAQPDAPCARRAPRAAPPRRCASVQPRLRLGLSRHWRVVSTVPSPSWSTRAALEHEVVARAAARRRARRSASADRSSSSQHVLAAPAVEAEAHATAPRRVRSEDRPGVAQPDVAEARGTISAAPPRAPRAPPPRLPAVDEQAHHVAARERAHQRRHVAARRFEVAVPCRRIGRPRRPDRLLRRPLRWNGQSSFRGRRRTRWERISVKVASRSLAAERLAGETDIGARAAATSAGPSQGQKNGPRNRPARAPIDEQ